MLNALAEFFTPEAGQRRRQWLNEQEERVGNVLAGYLGPAAQPIQNAALLAGYLSPGADMMDAADASGRLMNATGPLDAAAETAALIGATGMMFLPGNYNALSEGFSRAVDDMTAAYDPALVRSGIGAVTETPAQEVARLLREGRAADVTDDMMARVDPQEMWRLYESGATGAEMPMDLASRMARAQEMGFVNRAFHETPRDFQAFDVTRQGAGAGDFEMPSGVFTKPNSRTIGLGGDTESQIPIFYRTDAPAFARNRDEVRNTVSAISPQYERLATEADAYDARMADQYDAIFEGAPGREFLDANSDDYFAQADQFIDVWKQGNLDAGQAARAELDAALRAAGHDSMTVADDAGFLGRSTPTTVIFDPRNIRSQFARFDPRLAHLANLSAGIALPVIGLNALAQPQQQEQDRQAIMDWLATQ